MSKSRPPTIDLSERDRVARELFVRFMDRVSCAMLEGRITLNAAEEQIGPAAAFARTCADAIEIQLARTTKSKPTETP